MAHIVAITKLLDGARSAVFHVFIKADGASGDLSDEILIDPKESFEPGLRSAPCLTVEHLWYDLTGFSALLEFDYLLSDTPVWAMSSGNANHVDFCCFGGLKDRSGALDGHGKLKITTTGLSEAGDCGTIIIKVRKD